MFWLLVVLLALASSSSAGEYVGLCEDHPVSPTWQWRGGARGKAGPMAGAAGLQGFLWA